MAGIFAVAAEFFAADGAAAAVGEAAVAGAGEAAVGGAVAEGVGGAAVAEGVGGAAAAGSIVDATAAGYAGLDAASAASLGDGASVAGGAAGASIPSIVKTVGTQALGAGVSTAVGSLLAPKPPGRAGAAPAPTTSPVLPMPDPLAQQLATKRSLVEQLARRGRASTILTDTGGGKLGG